jgi:hypothetical protein
VLASFISSGRFLALQKILHEGRLVCGKTLTPSAEVQKGVTVFDEYRPQFSGRIRYCESAGMSGNRYRRNRGQTELQEWEKRLRASREIL